MRWMLTIAATGFVFTLTTSTSWAQFGDLIDSITKSVSDAASDIANETLSDATDEALGETAGLNCQVDVHHADAFKACFEQNLSATIDQSFKAYLNGEDINTHKEMVMSTLFTGTGSSWSNPETGASGQATVVSEQEQQGSTEIAVLKDKVDEVPPLDLIGANYRATSASNVRGGPGTDYVAVDKLALGDVVNVVGKVKSKNWFMISKGGVGSGFIYGNLLQPDLDAPPTDSAAPAGVVETTKAATTKTCRTVEQTVTSDSGEQTVETITACEGPNGWEIV